MQNIYIMHCNYYQLINTRSIGWASSHRHIAICIDILDVSALPFLFVLLNTPLRVLTVSHTPATNTMQMNGFTSTRVPYRTH